MATSWPLPRYWAQISARRSQVTTVWNSAFSWPPRYSLVAMLNWVTTFEFARARISGSRVRRPVNRTRFMRTSFARHGRVRACVVGGRRIGPAGRSADGGTAAAGVVSPGRVVEATRRARGPSG